MTAPRTLFIDAVRVQRRTRTTTTARSVDQDLVEISASAPCRIVDQLEQPGPSSELGKLSDSTARIVFLPEEDVELGDLLTSLVPPTQGRQWRVTQRRMVDRHSLQCAGTEVRDQ